MKYLIGLFAALVISTSSFGNTSMNVTPQLKVMAKSGLKLRLEPNLDSPVIDVIRYGAELEVEEDFVPLNTAFKIDWVEGKWIKVKYNGQIGFVFDGFLSKLSAPIEDAELTENINGLSYSLYEWAFNNYNFLGSDTLSDSEFATSTMNNLEGNDLFVYGSNEMARVEFTLSEIRIMDAYHLLESMMDTRSARSSLRESTIFYENAAGQLNKIKIGNGQVQIRELESGRIKISCQTIHEGC